MDKCCLICKNRGEYKCPTCLIYYCSVKCCKMHRENGCDVLVQPQDECSTSSMQSNAKYASADTVSEEKLRLLREDENFLHLLDNKHLRDILTTIDKAQNPELIMQMAMQEPILLEFVDTCLKVVQPPESE